MNVKVVCGTQGSKSGVHWVVGTLADFRCGTERLLLQVRETLGRSPLDGSTLVFRNQRLNRIKVLRMN